MRKDWTKKKLQAANEAMKVARSLGCKEFCEEIEKSIFTALYPPKYTKRAGQDNLIKQLSYPAL